MGRCSIRPNPRRWPVANLIFGLLPSCEPLHKLCQPSREGSLDWTADHSQEVSKSLKLLDIQTLVRQGVVWKGKRDRWRIRRKQGLHRDTLVGGTNAPLNAPCTSPCSGSLFRKTAGFCGECTITVLGVLCGRIRLRARMQVRQSAPDCLGMGRSGWRSFRAIPRIR
jgi:hypothetical protein